MRELEEGASYLPGNASGIGKLPGGGAKKFPDGGTESGESVPGAENSSGRTSGERTEPGQISFTADREPEQISFTAVAEQEVLEALRRCQPDTLTPIEAISLLYEWKKKIC